METSTISSTSLQISYEREKHCILDVGDHDWITETSYISFRDAREINTQLNLDSLIGTLVVMRAPLRPEILAKIVATAKATKGYRTEFKKYL